MADNQTKISEKFGQLASSAGYELPLIVCKSRAGYYIGTLDADGLPFSRESLEYWDKPDKAETAFALGLWTQRKGP